MILYLQGSKSSSTLAAGRKKNPWQWRENLFHLLETWYCSSTALSSNEPEYYRTRLEISALLCSEFDPLAEPAKCWWEFLTAELWFSPHLLGHSLSGVNLHQDVSVCMDTSHMPGAIDVVSPYMSPEIWCQLSLSTSRWYIASQPLLKAVLGMAVRWPVAQIQEFNHNRGWKIEVNGSAVGMNFRMRPLSTNLTNMSMLP
jgi:hypothetical protein